MRSEEEILKAIEDYVPNMTEGDEERTFMNKMQAGTANSNEEISKPIAKEFVEEARILSKDYHVTVDDYGDFGFVGKCEEIPTVHAEGKTEDECIRNAYNAITAVLSFLLECGEKIPEVRK